MNYRKWLHCMVFVAWMLAILISAMLTIAMVVTMQFVMAILVGIVWFLMFTLLLSGVE